MCKPDDLKRFSLEMKAVQVKWAKLFPTEELMMMRFLRAWQIEMLDYGVAPDETSREFVKKALSTYTMEDFHYAIHHIVWQMYTAGKSGIANIPAERMMFFRKVTEDCLEE